MNRIKKFWIVFLSFLPFGAGAIAPIVIGLIAGGVGIAGFSIYRSVSPVNINDALKFFSSCWTCQVFSDVMGTMSDLLPSAYGAIGRVTGIMAIALTAVWLVWKLVSGLLNAKIDNPWDITSLFSTHAIKLTLVIVLLFMPFPRLITDTVIQPIFSIGLSLNRIAGDETEFNTCLIATALTDETVTNASVYGAYSPQLRHNIACEIGTVHRLTGLGMTVGWTLMNMAFNDKYMYKILYGIPIFPNVLMVLAGALILVLYFFVLLPIPIYFLEIFVNLSMDLIMLPLLLLSWLFPDWVLPKGKSIKSIIDNVISGALGIAVTGVLLTFSVKFLDAAFGSSNGVSVLREAIDRNDSIYLIDGLEMANNSLVVVILMGLFMAMFMTSIPALAKTFFSVGISDKFYNTAKKDVKIIWDGAKKLVTFAKK